MKFKRFIAVFCSLLIVSVLAFNGAGSIGSKVAYADTKETSLVVLGDSISYGMSADQWKGFADLYKNHLNSLGSYGNVTLTNLSVKGDKASDLLNNLGKDSFKTALAKANIVVVCIGGNNLLSPLIAAIAKAFNINTSNNDNLLSDLTNALNSDGAFLKLAQLKSPESMTAIQTELTTGVTSFKTDYPNIVQEIKKQAPNAHVYLLNLYNPLDANDSFSPMLSPYVSGINDVVASQGQVPGCTIVDVNKAFSGNSEAVKFNLLTAQIDPHPTNKGHEIICNELIAVEKPAGNINNDNSNTKADNQNSSNNTDAVSGATGLTDDQKNTLTKAIDDAKQEKVLTQKLLNKSLGDASKYDKDYKNLKAKSLKANTKSDKNKLNLQLAAADAQKKMAMAYAEYYKAVIAKDDCIISGQDILNSPNSTSDDITSIQAKIDDANKLAASKKAAADNAMNLAKKAIAKAPK